MEKNQNNAEKNKKIVKGVVLIAVISAAAAAILAFKPDLPKQVADYLRKLKNVKKENN